MKNNFKHLKNSSAFQKVESLQLVEHGMYMVFSGYYILSHIAHHLVHT
jgi:hypothetical protein